MRGFWPRPIQPNDNANFEGSSKAYSGMSLASSQARAQFTKFTRFVKFGLLGAGLSQAKPAEFSEFSESSELKKINNLNHGLALAFSPGQVQGFS